MRMELIRRRMINSATEGDLMVDGKLFCHTLEDVVRVDPNPATPQNEAKVYGQTAIPAGSYRVVMTMSPKFKKILPRLLDVPGFDGILIHKGNGPEDTLGCILVGETVESGRIPGGASSPAFDRLMSVLTAAHARGEAIVIAISEDPCLRNSKAC